MIRHPVVRVGFPHYMRWPDGCENTEKNPERTYNGLVELYENICASGGVGVEVGCWSGESSEIACQFANQLFCVDPWETLGGSDAELLFDARMAVYDNVTKIKARSHEAAKQFPDESLDFVYIDGDHEVDSVCDDILSWLPKIRKGGWIAGHDYDINDVREGVVEAVDGLLGKPTHRYSDCSWAIRRT